MKTTFLFFLSSLILVLGLGSFEESQAITENPIAAKSWKPSFSPQQAALFQPRECMIYPNGVEDTQWGVIVNGQRASAVTRRATSYSNTDVIDSRHAVTLLHATQPPAMTGRPGLDYLGKIEIDGFITTPGQEQTTAILETQQVGVGAGWSRNTNQASHLLIQFIDRNCPERK